MATPRVEMMSPEGNARTGRIGRIGRTGGDDGALHELLTADDVATLLKVSKSWVYEHTRHRDHPRSERLPFVKIGKYVRFDPRAIAQFLARRSRIA